MGLTVDKRRDRGLVIVELVGELDVDSAGTLRDAISTSVDADELQIVLDLDRLDFMDSSGLGVLVGALKKVRKRGGSLHVICGNRVLLRTFHLTGLDKVLTIHASLASVFDDADAPSS